MTTPQAVQALQNRWLRPATLAVLCAAVAVALVLPAAPPARTAVLLLFFVLGPGLALIGLLGIHEPWQELALVIGTSLALDVAVAGALAYAGDGNSHTALDVLVGITAAGALAQLRPRRSGRHAGEAGR